MHIEQQAWGTGGNSKPSAKKKTPNNTHHAINENEASKLCAQHHAQFLLHGHTHVAGEHPLPSQESVATRLVLNAWEQQGHYLSWSDDGRYQFHDFNQTPGG